MISTARSPSLESVPGFEPFSDAHEPTTYAGLIIYPQSPQNMPRNHGLRAQMLDAAMHDDAVSNQLLCEPGAATQGDSDARTIGATRADG